MTESKISRLGDCEVCGTNAAKYTCPKCEVKTCSLDCVKIHKKELDCDGDRNKVKFVQMKKFSNLDLQSDYILLEEATRAVEKFAKSKLVKNPLRFQPFQPYFASYNIKQKKQRNAAWRRGISLKFLPNHFSKRKNNSIYYDQKKDLLFFTIEWIFPQAENFAIFTKRVSDCEKLAVLANRFLDEESCSEDMKEKLQYYQSAGVNGVTFLLKAESVPGEKFYELDHEESLKVNLKRKTIIEYPTIYVVLKDHKYIYEIIEPGDDLEIIEVKNDASVNEPHPDDDSAMHDVKVKSEISSECNEDDDLQRIEDSRMQSCDENSRYLFMCGEIDSDSGYDNEEIETECSYNSYQNHKRPHYYINGTS